MSDFPKGSVWLVGAGPGDPELLTRKAERLLRNADIVFYDALVSKGVLDLIPQATPRHSVGKRAGRHSVPQPMICDFLVKAALRGQRVVRLKGGDSSIFGRANEEIDACRDNGIIVQICAGVTTASAAAASLCASLTMRGLARRLTFVTAHTRNGAVAELDWQALADPQATIAVYMGKAAAPDLARRLMQAGLAHDTPTVLIENVSLPGERHFPTRLDMLPLAARTALGDGPAIILIGEAMREAKAWLQTCDEIRAVANHIAD
ncbi:MAG: uroporphyrinogen-III C-methyltransferase [Pseudomonadota bacterium]